MATCFNKPSYNRRCKVKCPQCNVESQGFIRSFLDLDQLCVNDDVSISDDEEEDSDEDLSELTVSKGKSPKTEI